MGHSFPVTTTHSCRLSRLAGSRSKFPLSTQSDTSLSDCQRPFGASQRSCAVLPVGPFRRVQPTRLPIEGNAHVRGRGSLPLPRHVPAWLVPGRTQSSFPGSSDWPSYSASAGSSWRSPNGSISPDAKSLLVVAKRRSERATARLDARTWFAPSAAEARPAQTIARHSLAALASASSEADIGRLRK